MTTSSVPPQGAAPTVLVAEIAGAPSAEYGVDDRRPYMLTGRTKIIQICAL